MARSLVLPTGRENFNVRSRESQAGRARLLVLTLAWLSAGPLAAPVGRQAAGQELQSHSPPDRRHSDTALVPLGTTYSRAQTAAWLDNERFVVGRWDGTLTVFRPMRGEAEFGPVLVDALTTPARNGIEMVVALGEGNFVSSNDDQSLVWWRAVDDGFLPLPLPFPPACGMAACATRVNQDDRKLLLVGHRQGYVSIWSLDNNGAEPTPSTTAPAPRLVRAVSVRSDNPIRWPGQTWHVRGLAACAAGRAISVAEDGDICLLDAASGTILSRQRYAATAQRGLNDVAVLDDLVAVASCAVGRDDKNLWIYRLAGNSLVPLASQALVANEAREQVFTFSAKLVEFGGQPCFIASTEEGLIWLGTIKDHKIVILGKVKVAAEGGVVLALAPENEVVLSVGHKIQTFAIAARPVEKDALLEQ